MAAGTDNVKRSSLLRRFFNSGSGDEEYGGGDTDALGKEPYQFIPTGTDRTTLRLCILLLIVPKMVLTLCNLYIHAQHKFSLHTAAVSTNFSTANSLHTFNFSNSSVGFYTVL